MGDKLDSTIDAVASMSNTSFEAPKIEKTRRNSVRKRKIDELEALERPNMLPGTSEVDAPEDSKFDEERSSRSISQDSQEDRKPAPIYHFQSKKRAPQKKKNEIKAQKSPSSEPTTTEIDPMSIWTASDDMALITAVSHVKCLQYVHNTLTFSRNFTLNDLETRFRQLMYDDKWSPVAWKRMNELPARVRLHIEARTPFTREEERTLMGAADRMWKGTGTSARKNKAEGDSSHTILMIEHFKKILEENTPPFHPSRTPQVLSDHFRRIKGYREVPKDYEKNNYESLDEKAEGNSAVIDIRAPLIAARARFHDIARYPLLRSLQNNFQTSASISDSAVAIIHGRFLQYSMTGKQAIMGRQSMYDKVDIDLSKEGPAAKVSRQQAVITHVSENEFRILNIGQRPMYVDSKPLPQGVGTSLKHGSIIEVAALRLIFSIPVPRELHPLLRNVAVQHLTQGPRGPGPLGPPGPPPAKKPRPQIISSGQQRTSGPVPLA